MTKDLFIITHIPKTAGTTLRRHLKHYLSADEELIHLANRGKESCQRKGIPYFTERPLEYRNQAKVIIGHDVNFDTKYSVTGKTIQEWVVFRDPIKWEISRYNQHVNRMVMRKQTPINFQTWLSEVSKFHSQIDWFLANYMCLGGRINFLSNKIKRHFLTHALENFKTVCTLDNFDLMLTYLLKQLNLPEELNVVENQNVVGVHKKDYFEASDDNLTLLNKLCEFDLSCYEHIKKTEKPFT